MADPEGGPGAPLFLDETKARRAEKNFFFEISPLPLLSEGLNLPLVLLHLSLFFLWAFLCVSFFFLFFFVVVVLAVVFSSSLNCHKT